MSDENLGRQLLTMVEASKTLPRTDGRRFSANSIWRWCRKGVKSRTGEIVHLEHVRLGGRIFTTAKWLADFGKRLAEADAEYFEHPEQHIISTQSLLPKPSQQGFSKQRLAQIEEAEKMLRDAGV